MQIIKILANDNGSHDNQTLHGALPDGWAVVPADKVCENFPFGEVEVEKINGVMIVTKWTPGEIPKPEPVVEEPSQQDIIEAQVTYTAMMTDTLLGV